MINKFIINKNNFLRYDTVGYYHQLYLRFREPGNPDFLNILKNTFNSYQYYDLVEARDKVIEILMHDIPIVMVDSNLQNCMLICIPRAKALESYSNTQLMLVEAVSIAANSIKGVSDGTECIRRITNTQTTHLRNSPQIPNDGDEPYPGITIATCRIEKNKISNKNIILIDDIYTKNVNIDEDCIQALLENGANKVIFYSIGYTRRG